MFFTLFIIGRICCRQLCRYCFYSRADFLVFRPAGATHFAPIKVEFGMEERTVGPLLHAKFHLDRFRGGVYGHKSEKMEFYEYNCL